MSAELLESGVPLTGASGTDCLAVLRMFFSPSVSAGVDGLRFEAMMGKKWQGCS